MKLSTFDAFKHFESDQCVILSDEQLKMLQKTLLGILLDINEVCRENGIRYVLGGGSALGAVRHQGFIPWDDDIDINMARADYDRFIPLFREKFGERYWVHTPEDTDNYALLYTRVRKKGTCVKTRDDFFCDECGAMVDIFVMENTYDNRFLRLIHGLGSMAFGLLVSCRKFYRDKNQLISLCRDDTRLRRVIRVKAFIGGFLAVFSINAWTRAANSWNRLCYHYDSENVVIPSGRKHFFGELYKRAGMCKSQEMTFEGKSIPCPDDLQTYLDALYGQNYMTPPRDSEKEAHVYLQPFLLNDQLM